MTLDTSKNQRSTMHSTYLALIYTTQAINQKYYAIPFRLSVYLRLSAELNVSPFRAMEILPDDILLTILKHDCDRYEVLSGVCKTWRRLCDTDVFWRHKVDTDLGTDASNVLNKKSTVKQLLSSHISSK